MFGVFSVAGVIVAIAVVIVGVALGKWAFGEDKKIKQRRELAIRLSALLQGYGLKRLPKVLTAYAVSDYAGMFEEVNDTVKVFESGEEAVAKEFDAVFQSILDAKLKTPEGMAYLRAKIAEADKKQ